LFVHAKYLQSVGFEIYVLDDPTSMDAISTNNFSVFTNPVNDVINMHLETAVLIDTDIKVTDVAGRTVINTQLAAGSIQEKINMGNLKPGIYFIQLGNVSRKFIKN
jgi:hypothetical protein